MSEEERTNDRRRIAALEERVRDLEARLAQTRPEPLTRLESLLGHRRLLETLPDFISIVDRDLRILYVNRIRGDHVRDDVIGSSVFDYVAPEMHARYRESIERVFREGVEVDVRVSTKRDLVYETHFLPIVEADEVAWVLTSSSDVTDRHRAELALRESETRLRHAVEASGMGTWSWTIGDDHVTWDARLCAIFGVDESRARMDYPTYLSFVPEEDRSLVVGSVEHAIATGHYDEFEHGIVRPDGAVRRVLCKGDVVRDASSVIVGLRGGVFDITERSRTEQRAHQAQKMEAIGRLTAGIAHNFNNLLGVILPSVDIARRSAPDAIVPRLDDIEHSALRAAEMVRELMLFARGAGDVERRRVDLVSVVARTASICRSTFGPNVTIELSAPDGLPPVAANAGQIEQVLLNVCLNARDAMEDGHVASPTIALRVASTVPGFVGIRIEDNGPGMDEATRESVFEPFFTTKEHQRGTGLGLSSAYAIVSEHRGRIECESRVGAGTTFVIELPIADDSVPAAEPERPRASRGGDEHILIIDDEEGIRRVVRAILEHAGYTVDEAPDGASGLRILDARGRPFDAIVVDRMMPGISGDELLVAIRERHAGPVIVLSGHPASVANPLATRVLAKPVSSGRLLDAVRDAIDVREALPLHLVTPDVVRSGHGDAMLSPCSAPW